MQCWKQRLEWAMVAMGVLASVVSAAPVESTDSAGAFRVLGDHQAAMIHVDPQDFPGVLRVAGDLAQDIGRVGGAPARVLASTDNVQGSPILVGTIGQSKIIDALIASKKLDVSTVKGKWEASITAVVDQPLPGVDRALVIAGSDKRGTIYGVYDLSEQMGVSPWYWWADVPTAHRDAVYVHAGQYVIDSPKVKYRGIFINDEEPALGPWAREKFGGINSKMYIHMFELILRLRGNYLWPAMWGKAFNEDDPENPRLADEYGVVMGTSHHEPMIRAQAEWQKHRKEMGNGEWNYATNEAGLKKFWTAGIARNKQYESIVTIGMRGDGDEPMIKGGDMDANVKLLEKIVADQRQIIADQINPDVTRVPQLWALYKEVADYYAHGMRVPDDVTLLWCDDNWGNLRRLPTEQERSRAGGAGIYYHFDYVGSPRSYKWLNTNPLPKVWEQMNLAYHYGANRIWIVNVGDLKPMEVPIDFFLKMAWDPEAMSQTKIADYQLRWAEREFGKVHAAEIADIVAKYAKYNGWRKPEMIDARTFSQVNYQEADRVVEAWQTLTARAEKLFATLPAEYRDAFFELVLYPTKASATVAELHIAAGRNELYARQGRASANDAARHARELFKLDQELSDAYHKVAGGKWNHMMAQTRIGYTSWSDPKTNVMPTLTELTIPDTQAMGVAIEGSENAWPGSKEQAVLPDFDSINQQQAWIDVFRRGSRTFDFQASSKEPWILLSSAVGTVDQDQRMKVSIDWSKAPAGTSEGTITIQRQGGESVDVKVRAVKSERYTRQNTQAAGGLTGPTVIGAADVSANIAGDDARWVKIPDYGRGEAAMTILPVTAKSASSAEKAPRLEYQVLIPQAGEIQVGLFTGPTLDFVPGRGVRVAVSFDDESPQVIDAFADQRFAAPRKRGDLSAPAIRDWHKWVTDNGHMLKSVHAISEPGVHTLKITMVDPAVVLESVTVQVDKVRPSYFGPPEWHRALPEVKKP